MEGGREERERENSFPVLHGKDHPPLQDDCPPRVVPTVTMGLGVVGVVTWTDAEPTDLAAGLSGGVDVDPVCAISYEEIWDAMLARNKHNGR